LTRVNYLRICAVLATATAMAAILSATTLIGSAHAIAGCDFGSCPPSVTSTVPFDGATNVDRDNNVEAQFFSDTGAMDPTTINASTVLLYRGNLDYAQLNPDCSVSCTTRVPRTASVSYDATTKSATLDPTNRLRAFRRYTAVVEGAGDTDGKAVKDSIGTEMSSDYIWHFKTGGS
jgi:hypothetical protein